VDFYKPFLDVVCIDEFRDVQCARGLQHFFKYSEMTPSSSDSLMWNVLFVCTGNVDRSPTAEAMVKNTLGINAKSAGTSYAATVPITPKLINWADAIFVMEDKHEEAIVKLVPSSYKKIRVLDIPDIFYRDQPELKKLLAQKLKPYFNAPPEHPRRNHNP